MATKLSIRSLYKVFGQDPEGAMHLIEEGKSKEHILEVTGSTVGVNDVSCDIEEGEIFVVMGLSGSGKSTLIRMLNGLIAPTSGTITIDGDEVARCGEEKIREIRRQKISMVFQHFALFPHKTVVENVAFGLKIKGVGATERRATAERALAQVGLSQYADSYPEQLSGGMQQRVGLARGLAAEPQVLLMDEPFGALDPLIRRDMQDELLELQRSLGKTIVFITHDLNEALILGDKIAIMKGGRFVQVGTAEEIVGSPADAYVEAFTKDIDRSRVFKVGRVAKPAEALNRAGLTVEGRAERDGAARLRRDLRCRERSAGRRSRLSRPSHRRPRYRPAGGPRVGLSAGWPATADHRTLSTRRTRPADRGRRRGGKAGRGRRA